MATAPRDRYAAPVPIAETAMQPKPDKDKARTKPGQLPIAAPQREKPAAPAGAPDLRIEEIEERHIPKDRNIFDK